jgi:Reverse transcriptase (RNA-dependent DNA polymerase)
VGRTSRVILRTVAHAGRQRTLAELGPDDARRYARAVRTVVGAIEAALGPEVLADRAKTVAAGNPGMELAPWRPARRRFEAAAGRMAGVSSALVVTDVRACYASIGNDALRSRLHALGCGSGDIGDVLRILDGFHDQGVQGLPVGPMPSAILANAVLSAVDAAIAGPCVRHLRWVDDVLVFARDERRARRALERIEGVLGDLGMRPAKEKTHVLDPRDPAVRGWGRVSTSGIRRVGPPL